LPHRRFLPDNATDCLFNNIDKRAYLVWVDAREWRVLITVDSKEQPGPEFPAMIRDMVNSHTACWYIST
jgi:hypothetical protein